eukprot:TRINITY_DN22580_c0_g1_i4.p1 TRINITY_DN22580_c0_g1~~TRINITY_DN22580_c0_g1_i4.p1  ORF type:complete len:493 (+),score=134.91 TRINITY_DN22580_c0_g1_i4:96-1574(+)
MFRMERHLEKLHSAFEDLKLHLNVGAYSIEEVEKVSTDLLLACTASAPCRDSAVDEEFTTNYRVLFPTCEERYYNCDVLDAAFATGYGGRRSVEVNGVAHFISEDVLQAWASLTELLLRWPVSLKDFLNSSEAQTRDATRDDLQQSLMLLDETWACFEKSYISALIQVEQAGRSPLVDAIEAWKPERLEEGEDGRADSAMLNTAMAAISKLNAIANVHGKGRSDFRGALLQEARDWLHSVKAALHAQGATRTLIRLIAGGVADAFDRMQEYLQRVEPRLAHLDPELARNTCLSEQLLNFEQSWDMGERYLANAGSFRSLCAMVARLEAFREESEALAEMMEENGPELFMVLPRLVWLSALLPAGDGRHVLEEMLPEADFTHLEELWSAVSAKLHRWFRPSPGAEEEELQGVFVLFAVAGVGGAQEVLELLQEEAASDNHGDISAGEVIHTMEEMLREMESWSMQLQRRNPTEWNSLSAVLLGSLQGAASENR